MYTIFKNESSVVLSESKLESPSVRSLRWTDENLELVLGSLKRNEAGNFQLYGKDVRGMWQDFMREFKVIEAAGGIVRNSRGQVLLIYRNDTWDLPKGKIDKGETKEQAAVREVSEECGFGDLELEDFLTSTYHIYEEGEKHILKITYWYNMLSDQTDLQPQVEEGITALSWMDLEGLEPVFANTYPNMRLLLGSLRP